MLRAVVLPYIVPFSCHNNDYIMLTCTRFSWLRALNRYIVARDLRS